MSAACVVAGSITGVLVGRTDHDFGMRRHSLAALAACATDS